MGCAAAHHHVHALGQQIDRPVAAAELDLDLRIALEKIGQRRRQHVAAGRRRHIDAQATARVGAPLRDRAVELVEVGQQALHAFEIRRAIVAERQAPRRAVQQLDRQVLFELLHEHGDAGLGPLQLFGRAREAAELGNTGEGLQGAQSVHRWGLQD